MNKINDGTAKIKDMAKNLKEMSLKVNEDEVKTIMGEEVKKQETGEDKLGDEGASERTRYEEALYCLTDPLLPVRGHGLIELTRLVKEKDKQTIKHVAKVIEIFRVSFFWHELLMVVTGNYVLSFSSPFAGQFGG